MVNSVDRASMNRHELDHAEFNRRENNLYDDHDSRSDFSSHSGSHLGGGGGLEDFARAMGGRGGAQRPGGDFNSGRLYSSAGHFFKTFAGAASLAVPLARPAGMFLKSFAGPALALLKGQKGDAPLAFPDLLKTLGEQAKSAWRPVAGDFAQAIQHPEFADKLEKLKETHKDQMSLRKTDPIRQDKKSASEALKIANSSNIKKRMMALANAIANSAEGWNSLVR
jgi:hypothetical protein